MKKLILATIAMAFVFIACNSSSEKQKESAQPKKMDTTAKKDDSNPIAEQLYSCPMHPEVIGKKDEKCSKCGMKLTVPVNNKEVPK